MKQESEQLWEAYVNSLNKPEQDLVEEKAKPDFLDADGDGDKKEPMKKALKDKETKKGDDDDSDSDQPMKEEVGVHHDRFGFGIVVSENMNEDGNIGWYDVQFEHGREVVNAVDLKLI